MLWNASTINGFAVDAADGQAGTVADLLFDEQSWIVKLLVIDSAAGRVTVPVAAVGKPDAETSRLPIDLTLAQVAAAPAADLKLRSMAEFETFGIQATDGNIGRPEDFLIRDNDWQIMFITVDAQSWEPGEKVMISRHAVTGIDHANKLVALDVDRQAVKDSPAYDAGISVDGADDEKFLSYFGIKFVDTKTA